MEYSKKPVKSATVRLITNSKPVTSDNEMISQTTTYAFEAQQLYEPKMRELVH